MAEGQRLAALSKKYRCSNGGNQADDEEETFKDSDVSLAILGKKLHNLWSLLTQIIYLYTHTYIVI